MQSRRLVVGTEDVAHRSAPVVASDHRRALRRRGDDASGAWFLRAGRRGNHGERQRVGIASGQRHHLHRRRGWCIDGVAGTLEDISPPACDTGVLPVEHDARAPREDHHAAVRCPVRARADPRASPSIRSSEMYLVCSPARISESTFTAPMLDPGPGSSRRARRRSGRRTPRRTGATCAGSGRTGRTARCSGRPPRYARRKSAKCVSSSSTIRGSTGLSMRGITSISLAFSRFCHAYVGDTTASAPMSSLQCMWLRNAAESSRIR